MDLPMLKNRIGSFEFRSVSWVYCELSWPIVVRIHFDNKSAQNRKIAQTAQSQQENEGSCSLRLWIHQRPRPAMWIKALGKGATVARPRPSRRQAQRREQSGDFVPIEGLKCCLVPTSKFRIFPLSDVSGKYGDRGQLKRIGPRFR
jgi:hypothetical protein